MSDFMAQIDLSSLALAALLGKFLLVPPDMAEALCYASVLVCYTLYRGAMLYLEATQAPVEVGHESDKLSEEVAELETKMNAVMLKMGFEKF